MSEQIMLELNNVSKTFFPGTINAKTALDHLTLTVNRGDFITVIGGNGAGKSTMMNAISGVFLPDEGNIVINGKDVTHMSEPKRAAFIGRVFQDPMMGTAPNMEIEENLALAFRRGKRHGFGWHTSSVERAIFREELSRLGLGLEERMTSKVGLLSGGQRQALTLLMATLQNPELLLLDEHTAALDPKTAAMVLALSEQIIHENDLTTLMVTHNMNDAIRYGNRLIMMHNGRIIYDVSGEEKKNLTVEMLIAKFSETSGEAFASDRALLS